MPTVRARRAGRELAARPGSLTSAPPRGSSEPVELAVTVKHETDDGLLLTDGATTAWVPRRLVELGERGTATMPEWLAKDRGFI